MANLPVPSPRTWVPGETEVGSYLNVSVRDLGNFLLNPPIGSFYQGAAQTVANNAWTPISFDQTINDSYGAHSGVTNPSRYTAQVTGWYTVSGAVSWVNNTTGARGAGVYVNGAVINGGSGVAAPSPGAAVTVTAIGAIEVHLNAGDYVELFGYQIITGGGTLSTQTGGAFSSYFTVDWRHA